MLVYARGEARLPLQFNRFIGSIVLALAFLVMSGCAGGLSQSLKQSLSVVNPKQIDFAELEFYAKRSNSAYDSIDTIRKTYPMVTRVTTIQSVDIRYFIETDKSTQKQTLSIRGTADKPNIWQDIEIAFIKDSVLGIAVHRGFRRDALAVFRDAMPYVRKDIPLRITGHSLGGAIAALLGAYYQKKGYIVERVVTFGQPRVTQELPPNIAMSRLSEFGTRPGAMSVAPTSAPIRTRRVEFRPTLVGWPHRAMTETSTPPAVPNRRPTNEELRALVDEHGAAIYRVAIGIVRDPALAEDVVQETIIRVWKSLPTFRGESPIRGWILRIAHNVAVSLLRKIRDEAWDPDTIPEVTASDDVSQTVVQRDDLVALGEALDGLDELSRSLIVLREVEGLSYDEIAETL